MVKLSGPPTTGLKYPKIKQVLEKLHEYPGFWFEVSAEDFGCDPLAPLDSMRNRVAIEAQLRGMKLQSSRKNGKLNLRYVPESNDSTVEVVNG
jgi:hypothetical protein